MLLAFSKCLTSIIIARLLRICSDGDLFVNWQELRLFLLIDGPSWQLPIVNSIYHKVLNICDEISLNDVKRGHCESGQETLFSILAIPIEEMIPTMASAISDPTPCSFKNRCALWSKLSPLHTITCRNKCTFTFRTWQKLPQGWMKTIVDVQPWTESWL